MSRYKGQVTKKHIERIYPHHVDVPIPENGLGRRLDQMHEWHVHRGIHPRFGSAEITTARFCFADRPTADAFAAAFSETSARLAEPK